MTGGTFISSGSLAEVFGEFQEEPAIGSRAGEHRPCRACVSDLRFSDIPSWGLTCGSAQGL